MEIPLSYGPKQKFLARLNEDPDLKAPAIQLPRMAFELKNITYDPERILGRNSVCKNLGSPVPYNLEYELTVMVKYTEDGSKIIEQIIPFFRPSVSHGIELIEDSGEYIDVSVNLDSVIYDDTYEGDFQERSVLIWTLNFTLKGFFFGPNVNRKLIKFAKVNTHTDTNPDGEKRVVTVRPGLTVDGIPTENSEYSISHDEIMKDDDWGYIVEIKDE